MTLQGSENDEVRPRERSGLLHQIGPGIISGAANDDPVAITTYVQVGAAHGYGLLWLVTLCFPIMWLVNETAARIGRTTGLGLAANMREFAPRWMMMACVLLLLLANVLQIGANLAMMGEAMAGVTGLGGLVWVLGFGALSILLQVFVDYERYVAILQWATLSLLSYIVAVLLVGVSWSEALAGLLPRLTADGAVLASAVAVLGVALSPYVLFWQANHEAEHQRVLPGRRPLLKAPRQGRAAISRIRLSTAVGMAVATLVAVAIVLTSAAALHAAGTREVTTAAAAAQALVPVVGNHAFLLFALGIVGTGRLAIPVLAGSAGYALAEAMNERVGLGRHHSEARAFYLAIAIATAAGAAMNLLGIDPLQAVIWSATLNGIAAVPVLLLMTIIAARRDAMGRFAISLPLLAGLLAVVALMTLAVLALAWSWVT